MNDCCGCNNSNGILGSGNLWWIIIAIIIIVWLSGDSQNGGCGCC